MRSFHTVHSSRRVPKAKRKFYFIHYLSFIVPSLEMTQIWEYKKLKPQKTKHFTPAPFSNSKMFMFIFPYKDIFNSLEQKYWFTLNCLSSLCFISSDFFFHLHCFLGIQKHETTCLQPLEISLYSILLL